MSRLVLAGAGGFGREVFLWAREALGPAPSWDDVVFIDDKPDALGPMRFPAVQIGSIAGYVPQPDDRVAITTGLPDVKKRIHSRLIERGARFHTLRHPASIVGSTSEIGEGSILCAGAIVTSNVRIGRFVTLNLHATVGHDATLADYTTLSAHADVTGGVTLDEGVFLGSHAVVVPRVRVGAFALLGAGTVAIRNVEPGATLVGVPGRKVGRHSGLGRNPA